MDKLKDLPRVMRPPWTVFEALQVPAVPQREIINGTIPAAGGSLTIVTDPGANFWKEVSGGYVRQTGGAARNFQVELFDGATAFPISDNNTSSKALAGVGIIVPGDILRITAEAAANVGTWQGAVFRHRKGFGVLNA